MTKPYDPAQNSRDGYALAIREMRRAKLAERAAQKASAPPVDERDHDEAEAK